MASKIQQNRLSKRHSKILEYSRYIYKFLKDTPCIPKHMWDDCFQEAMLAICQNAHQSNDVIKLAVATAITRYYHAETAATACHVAYESASI